MPLETRFILSMKMNKLVCSKIWAKTELFNQFTPEIIAYQVSTSSQYHIVTCIPWQRRRCIRCR